MKTLLLTLSLLCLAAARPQDFELGTNLIPGARLVSLEESLEDYEEQPNSSPAPAPPQRALWLVPGSGECWKEIFLFRLRYVRTSCRLCPPGSIILENNMCSTIGIRFSPFN